MKPNPQLYTAVSTPRLLFITLAVITFFTGCMSMDSSYGTPIDSEKVSQIVKGRTTRIQIEAMFGKPDMTSLIADGRRMISYSYTSTKMGINGATAMLGPFAKVKGATQTQSLQIYVNKDGIVEDYEFSDNTRDIEGQGLNVKSSNH